MANIKFKILEVQMSLPTGTYGSRSLVPLMLNLALDRDEWSNSRPAAFTSGNNLGNNRDEG